MAVRSTMAAIIARTRLKINDPAGVSQVFADQDIQDQLDLSREDVFNLALDPQWTYGPPFGVFDYLSSLTDWEDGLVLKQYLTVVVTPATSENEVGHWTFTANTFPPVFITGKTYDIYRASADLLEMMAARWVLRYSMSVDGQSLQRGNVNVDLQKLAMTYRQKQRVSHLGVRRSDLAGKPAMTTSLGATELDKMASG